MLRAHGKLGGCDPAELWLCLRAKPGAAQPCPAPRSERSPSPVGTGMALWGWAVTLRDVGFALSRSFSSTSTVEPGAVTGASTALQRVRSSAGASGQQSFAGLSAASVSVYPKSVVSAQLRRSQLAVPPHSICPAPPGPALHPQQELHDATCRELSHLISLLMHRCGSRGLAGSSAGTGTQQTVVGGGAQRASPVHRRTLAAWSRGPAPHYITPTWIPYTAPGVQFPLSAQQEHVGAARSGAERTGYGALVLGAQSWAGKGSAVQGGAAPAAVNCFNGSRTVGPHMPDTPCSPLPCALCMEWSQWPPLGQGVVVPQHPILSPVGAKQHAGCSHSLPSAGPPCCASHPSVPMHIPRPFHRVP